MRRRIRIVAAAAAVAIVALVAWAYLPLGRPRAMRCTPYDRPSCTVTTGRILYVQKAGDRGEIHLVLASPQSVSLPGISVITIPRHKRPRSGPHFGQWITVVGLPSSGDHGVSTLGAVRFTLR